MSSERWLRFLVLFSSISLHFISAYSDDPSNGTKPEENASDSGSKKSTAAIICLLLAAVALLSIICLFRCWKKKKRDEQYAYLLKMFAEDDELELELGLRD